MFFYSRKNATRKVIEERQALRAKAQQDLPNWSVDESSSYEYNPPRAVRRKGVIIGHLRYCRHRGEYLTALNPKDLPFMEAIRAEAQIQERRRQQEAEERYWEGLRKARFEAEKAAQEVMAEVYAQKEDEK